MDLCKTQKSYILYIHKLEGLHFETENRFTLKWKLNIEILNQKMQLILRLTKRHLVRHFLKTEWQPVP